MAGGVIFAICGVGDAFSTSNISIQHLCKTKRTPGRRAILLHLSGFSLVITSGVWLTRKFTTTSALICYCS